MVMQIKSEKTILLSQKMTFQEIAISGH